ncbi:hypothetical protein [Pseudomonas sp. 5P_3.1_Bac2]|uniref:hypothetical protein n=1 Tax=Pseudomonas sp. 5P_3.1_Bac2 TaxID=2971617 RepID=UPI0021C6C8E8|nr:hypothetical protein [Pseudomonas sp. 5P_3.1_Bac2]MCU1717264.1 hypothetical protein [Pseudomonas sp. 5P_3.1_Bac2]
MNTFFEFTYRNQTYVSFATQRGGELLAYPYVPGALHEFLLQADYDVERFKQLLIDSSVEQRLPAATAHERQPIPPLLPAHKSAAVISGFGLTNKKKVLSTGNTVNPLPVWFYKGPGHVLKADGDTLMIESGITAICEEAEIVLIYIIDAQRKPRYIGFTVGNDITDIGAIKASATAFSYAKLKECSVSERVFLGPPPLVLTGTCQVYRNQQSVFSSVFETGLDQLYYQREHLTDSLFSSPSLRQPGLVHYLYIGADRNSYDHGHALIDGDTISLRFNELDLGLSNPLMLQSA